MGHRVFLITETRSSNGIPGVTELVPRADQPELTAWLQRILSFFLRKAGIDPEHAWRFLSFLSLLRKCEPDIVHVHFAYSYYGWLAGLAGCRPLVVTVMGGDILFEEQGNPTPTGKWLTLELLRRADYITSKSDYLTSVLDRLGKLAAKAERIVWGIPLSKFRRTDAAALRSSLGLRSSQRVVLSPKILQPLYQVHLVVEAMSFVVRDMPEAVLLVTEYRPDPDYRAYIARRVVELSLDRHVLFCGSINHQDMPQYYSIADIAVAVPSSDGLPQTLFEGMACETPSILSKLSRYEEIVHHEYSAYFVETNPSDIAAGMLRLLRDASLRATIARNALRIVTEEANLDEQSGRVERRYRELAKTVPARAFTLSGLWSAWRSLRQFQASHKQ